MSNRESSLENRIEEIVRQLQSQNKRIGALEEHLRRPAEVASLANGEESASAIPEEASEKLLSWLGKSSLLQRLATVCFLMVVALVLRTVTDNDILDKEVGSLLGMIYAFGLIAWGWRCYRRSSSLAPVFAMSGAFLLFSIVVETHEHFESLSTVPAYVLIAVGGIAMALIAHLYKVALPVFVGTIGMCFAGVALDFPSPVFPYLLVLLLCANILGTFATRLQRCTWLRWVLFGVTAFMIQVWGFRLGMFLVHSEAGALPFSVAGFFPAVVLLGLVYMTIAIMGILGRISERISRFDFLLPSVNVIWVFTVARYVVNAGLGSEIMLGLSGVFAALGHLGVAFWLGRRRVEGARGTNSFAFAAALLLVMALPLATGNRLVSLAAFSALALGMAVLSRRWRSGGMRVTSYLLQLYACGALALLLRMTETTTPSIVGAVASGALAGIAFWHYLWARNQPPPAESVFFDICDKEDRTAVSLLLASLAGGFFTLRVGIYQALGQMGAGEDIVAAFASGQTVLINAAAAILMCYGFARRNKEVRNVAILVMLAGGGKVFFLDLLGLRGIPVVVSVLSFGVAASLESFALTRWQRIDALRISKWPPERKAEKGPEI
jgi:hypothetical protein